MSEHLRIAVLATCLAFAGVGCGNSNSGGNGDGGTDPTGGEAPGSTGGTTTGTSAGTTAGSTGATTGGTTAGATTGGTTSGTTGGTTAGSGPVLDIPALAWGTCVGNYGKAADFGIPIPGGDFKMTECAAAKMPLDWSKPQGQTVDVYIGRKKATKAGAPQVWFLQGGPGGSAADMITPMAIVKLFGQTDVDYYFMEHRGVGSSSYLGCPTTGESATSDQAENITAAEWPACVGELKQTWTEAGLKQFNTTNAAYDLAAGIKATKDAGQGVYVYGVSYGTYWAHRYVQVTPELPTGVILDFIVPPEGQYLSDFEKQFDPAGKVLADLCPSSAECKKAFPTDVWKTWSDLYNKQRTDVVCANTGFDPGDLRIVSAIMLQQNVLNGQIPALLSKFGRCNAQDQKDLKTFVDNLQKLLGGGSPAKKTLLDAAADAGKFSQALYENVAFGELWPTPPPTKAALERDIAAAVIGTGGALDQIDAYGIWPRYEPDAYVRQWATKPVALLMMNGTLDVQTPIATAELFKARFTAKNQTFVKVPYGNHGIIFQSQTSEQLSPFCGTKLIAQFVKDANATLDTSCAAKVLPPDFKGNSQINTQLWGKSDIWSAKAPSPEELASIAAQPKDFVVEIALRQFAEALRRKTPSFLMRSR